MPKIKELLKDPPSHKPNERVRAIVNAGKVREMLEHPRQKEVKNNAQ